MLIFFTRVILLARMGRIMGQMAKEESEGMLFRGKTLKGHNQEKVSQVLGRAGC